MERTPPPEDRRGLIPEDIGARTEGGSRTIPRPEAGAGDNVVRGGGGMRAYGSSVSVPAIERLKGRQNYSSWSFSMKMLLIREGTWCAVKLAQGQQADPDVSDRALATICLSVEKNIFSIVKKAKTASEAWTKLQKSFQDKGLIRRFGLLDQLTTVKLENFSSVEDFVDRLVTVTNDVEEIGFEVNDQWLSSLLMKGLPKYYHPMVMGMQASGMELTADVVKAKILQDVQWPLETSSEEALYSKQRSRVQPRGRNECYSCGEVGHFAMRCPKKQSRRDDKALCTMLARDGHPEEEWYIDSGATSHMARSSKNFVNQEVMVSSIGTANNQSLASSAKGLVKLDLLEGPIDVREVLQVPNLATNLLSVSQMCKKGLTVVFKAERCEIRDKKDEVIASGTEVGGLYRLNFSKQQKTFLAAESNIWHRRLGHLSRGSMQKLTTMVDGIDLKNEKQEDCVACAKGKHARDSFHSSSTRAEGLLDLVYSDVCGPIETSHGGGRFFVTFIDDASRRVCVNILKSKSEVGAAFQRFKAEAERQTGRKVKILRSDNGTEYLAMKKDLERDGIVHQTSCPYTPEQNGLAERVNRTLVEKARSMMNDAGLSKKFWAEAISTAAYLVNRCPTSSLQSMTPEEAWTRKKPNLKHLKVFGSRAMVHIPKVQRKKFDAKSEEGIFVGYGEHTKGYRVYFPATGKINNSRDVIFVNEGRAAEQTIDQQPVEFMELSSWFEGACVPEGDTTGDGRSSGGDIRPSGGEVGSGDGEGPIRIQQAVDCSVALPPQLTRLADEHTLRRSGRERVPNGKYSDYVCLSSHTGHVVSPQNDDDEDDWMDQPNYLNVGGSAKRLL